MDLLSFLLGVALGWIAARVAGARRKRDRVHRATLSKNLTSVPHDPWEGSLDEVDEALRVKAKLHINYTAGDGTRAERTVTVRRFGQLQSTVLFLGHCQLRNATRSFRADRVTQAVDAETGEVIEDVALFLAERYDCSLEPIKETLLRDEKDTLRALFFVAKADGQFRAPEKDIIASLCSTITGDPRFERGDVGDLLEMIEVPSLVGFRRTIGRIAKRTSDERTRVAKAAAEIVGTQKTVHASEKEALDYIRSRFKLP